MQKPKLNKKVSAITYNKSGLLESSLFSVVEKDILKLALKDGEQVTLKQAQNAIKKFKEGI